ncbi:hypothetical protein AtNW77_Chr5g0138761 [Arabidopsis thaliana]|uniref:Uncharacterized protein n=5 Tax=Arabidopsis TaxID=3701 RepID=Q9FI05_ARATH|nr:unnamed protein product [Arabidopsis thaliana]
MKKRLSLKQILVTLSKLGVCLCVKHLDSNKIQVSNTEIKNGSVCPEDELVSEEKVMEGRRRIKVVITRKQLDRLLAKQVSLEQLAFVNQRTSLSCFDESKWIPRLESIHESPELEYGKQSKNRGNRAKTGKTEQEVAKTCFRFNPMIYR